MKNNSSADSLLLLWISSLSLILIRKSSRLQTRVRKWVHGNKRAKIKWDEIHRASTNTLLNRSIEDESVVILVGRIVDLVGNFYACPNSRTNGTLSQAKARCCPSTSASPPAILTRCSLDATHDLLSIRGPRNGRPLCSRTWTGNRVPKV